MKHEGQQAVAASTEPAGADSASAPFLGQWRRLVSTTNWEKGRIIGGWRQALVQAGAPPIEYADEAWARRVGGVTGQHVGRLRRVHERFGSRHADFAGLFWSHFQAALEWADAEMWLEGAVQNKWSVADMRAQRWETRAALEADAAGATAESNSVEGADADEEAIDEDFSPDDDGADRSSGASVSKTTAEDRRRTRDDSTSAEDDHDSGQSSAEGSPTAAERRAAPFARLPELPDDLAEAFEAFKLAIVRHRLGGWTDVAREDVLAALAALGELALAPAD